MSFHVGQKVVCVNDDWVSSVDEETLPREGEVYTVRSIEDGADRAYLQFEEIINPILEYGVNGQGEVAFSATCFRPIVEKKTETGFAILEEIRKRESEGAPAPGAPARTIT